MHSGDLGQTRGAEETGVTAKVLESRTDQRKYKCYFYLRQAGLHVSVFMFLFFITQMT